MKAGISHVTITRQIMHETGHSKLVHWDNPEGRNGMGRKAGGGIHDGGHMYTHG